MSASWKIMMNEGYFLEIDVEYTKELYNLHSNLPFLPERKKKYVISLSAAYMTKKNTSFT